jgi:hypothetical protein
MIARGSPMHTQTLQKLTAFDFKPHPRAAVKVKVFIDSYLASFLPAALIAREMTSQTATRFQDWVDTLFIPYSEAEKDVFLQLGFVPLNPPDTAPTPKTIFDGHRALAILHHPTAIFPQIVLWNTPKSAVAIKVDSVADFIHTHGLDETSPILGPPMGRLRIAAPWSDPTHILYVIERHGDRGYNPGTLDPFNHQFRIKALTHLDSFDHRRRSFDYPALGFSHAQYLIHAAIDDLGVDYACDLFFQAERRYWQARNTAARIQKARQDSLGLGWSNHDHHTYRSSRACFKTLIQTLELLGFTCRERFYAGREAGWGAQVLEQPHTGITVFADVDLQADEIVADFPHSGLPCAPSLGTVGLWCALHGEAFLQAGMHHLECQFDFDALGSQLQQSHTIFMMKPFTDFPHLRQAFTQGEIWQVDPERLDRLRSQNLITTEQADKFAREGALGSHLENLQREGGFKGFNQTGISQIIAETDPRNGPK